MFVARKGTKVILKKLLTHSNKIRICTVGEVIGVKPGTEERLIKWQGKAWPVACTVDDLSPFTEDPKGEL